MKDEFMGSPQENTNTTPLVSKHKPLWFKHDVGAAQDEKLLQLRVVGGWEEVGIWWAFAELLCTQDGYKLKEKTRAGAALFLNLSLECFDKFVSDCVEAGLLVVDKGFIYSEGLLKRMEAHEKVSQARAEAARQRGKDNPPDELSKSKAIAEQLQSNSKAILLSNLFLSNLFLSSDPDLSAQFKNGGGLKTVILPEIQGEQVLCGWLSSGLDRRDFAEGLRAYDAWKYKRLREGAEFCDDDSIFLGQTWIKTEVAKLKRQMLALKNGKGLGSKIDWDKVFEGRK